MSDYMRRLIEINVARDISKILQITAGANIQLANVELNVKSQTITNLRRGNASALSGEAFALYQTLACVFDFPVFSVGRAESCLLSVNEGITPSKDAIIKDLRAMWKLCNPGPSNKDAEWWWQAREVEGHRAGWTQFTVPRPKQLNMEALCHIMKVNSVFDLAPKANFMRAAVALEQGEVLNITPHLRRTS